MRPDGMTFELSIKVQRAIALYQRHLPTDGRPYYGAFSGGKDSVVIKRLAEMAQVPVEWHYNVTTIDPPELVRFIREHHKEVAWNRPKHGNLALRVGKKGYPTLVSRWCCSEYKEGTPKDRLTILGVRIQESRGRNERYKTCYMEGWKGRPPKLLPIRLWADADVWGFINHYQVPYCSLYDDGFDRLGCVGCPLAGQHSRDMAFARWPKIENLWKRGFEKLWQSRMAKHAEAGTVWNVGAVFEDWQSLFRNWRKGKVMPDLVSPRLPFDFGEDAGDDEEDLT